MPVDRGIFEGAKPRFVGLTTLAEAELEGYRIWRDARGGTFSTLQALVDWPGAAPTSDEPSGDSAS